LGTIRGTDGTVDITRVAISFKGYLVMNLDNDTNSLIDANMIIYGKDPNGHKVYVQLNASDSNAFLNSYTLERGDKRHFYALNGKSPFDFNSFMMGNVRNTNIGLAKRILIAPDLKGVITGEDGIFFSLDQKIAGVGSISASLYTLATKGVNDLNNPDPITPRTQDGIIAALKGIGEYNHKYYDHLSEQYTALSIPAP
jgi:hypothetical protein